MEFGFYTLLILDIDTRHKTDNKCAVKTLHIDTASQVLVQSIQHQYEIRRGIVVATTGEGGGLQRIS